MPKKIIDLDALKKFRQETDEKYVIEGEYSPNTKVGYADESGALTPYGENSGASDTSAFVMQTTGGSSDVGALAYCKALRGNSVAWNQLFNLIGDNRTDNTSYSSNTTTNSFVLTITTSATVNRIRTAYTRGILGHKYLIKCKAKYNTKNESSSLSINCDTGYNYNVIGGTLTNAYVEHAAIWTCDYNGVFTFGIRGTRNVNDAVEIKDLIIIDLTLLGKEYSTVLAFNRDYPLPYYSYNAGQLLSSQTKGIKNVGYNALSLDRTAGTLSGFSNTTPRTFEEGKYYLGLADNNYYSAASVDSFSKTSNSISIQVNNGGYGVAFPCRVVDGQNYTLETDEAYSKSISWYDQGGNYLGQSLGSTKTISGTAPNNAYWGVIVLRPATGSVYTYSNIALHLTWDGSRTGYEPYEYWEYALPNIELRSAGNVYDELKPDGTLIRRVGVVDLGTLSWSASGLSTETNHIWYVNNFDGKIRTPNLLCVKYVYVEEGLYSTTPNTICVLGDNSLRVNTGSSSDTPTGLLFYELATQTTEQNDAYKYQEVQNIDDFGTQQALSDQAIQVPQGFDFFYPVDYKAFIDSLGGREDIEYDASQLVSQAQLQEVDDVHDALYDILQENIGGALRHQISGVDFNNTAWVDLGSLTWTKETQHFFATAPTNVKASPSYATKGNYICSHYADTNYDTPYGQSVDKTLGVGPGTSPRIVIYDSSLSSGDATAFKNAMKGILLAYEKA